VGIQRKTFKEEKVEKRMSKMLAIMFALALAFAYSCGGSGGSGSGGAAGYTPDNEPSSSGPSSLTTLQQTQVEQEVKAFVTALGGAFSMTSRAAEMYSDCIPGEVVEGCATSRVCYEASGSENDAHIKVWTDEAMNCNGVNLYFFEYDFDMQISGQQVTMDNAAGAIDIEYLEEFANPVRIFVKWNNDGDVEGWIAEDGMMTATIDGTTSNPIFAWE